MTKIFIAIVLLTISTARLVDPTTIKELLLLTSGIHQRNKNLIPFSNLTIGNEVSYCGEYKSKCMSSEWLSLTSELQLSGMMHHFPVYAEHTLSVYNYQQCEKENKMQSMIIKGSLQNTG